jgi:hypothetical protein
VGSPAGSGGLRLSAYAEGGGIAWIMLEMPDAGPARIALFDLGGRRIARLIDGTLGAGTHRWPWNGQADDGRRLAGRGVYFVRAEIDGPGGAKTLRTKLMLRP